MKGIKVRTCTRYGDIEFHVRLSDKKAWDHPENVERVKQRLFEVEPKWTVARLSNGGRIER